jgi:hypothetical protein
VVGEEGRKKGRMEERKDGRKEGRKEGRMEGRKGERVYPFLQLDQIRKPDEILWFGFGSKKLQLWLNTTLFSASNMESPISRYGLGGESVGKFMQIP